MLLRLGRKVFLSVQNLCGLHSLYYLVSSANFKRALLEAVLFKEGTVQEGLLYLFPIYLMTFFFLGGGGGGLFLKTSRTLEIVCLLTFNPFLLFNNHNNFCTLFFFCIVISLSHVLYVVPSFLGSF